MVFKGSAERRDARKLRILALLALLSAWLQRTPGVLGQNSICTIQTQAIYNSNSSISLGETRTTSTVDDCVRACQSTQGCNVFLYCPGSAARDCPDGKGNSNPPNSCVLLNETLVNGIVPLVQQAGSAATTSGVCVAAFAAPPPPVASAPQPAAPSPPAPSPQAPSVLVAPFLPQPAASTSHVAAAAGAAAGGVAFVALLAVGWWLLRKRRRTPSEHEHLGPRPTNPYLSNPFENIDAEEGIKTVDTKTDSTIASLALGPLPTIISADITTEKTSSTDDSATANFLVIQQTFGDQAANLPEPWLTGGAEDGVASILLHPKPTEPFEDEKEELRDTWMIDPKDLSCQVLNGRPVILGEGGFGRVFQGHLNREEVAVKVITSHTPKQQQSFLKEIHTLRACTNPHIVQFIGAFVQDNQTFMVTEFMPRGNLQQRVADGGKSEFGWYSKGRQVALEILQGLIYLHSRDIAHLDLKSPNILLTADDHAKIGDVGLGKMMLSLRAGPAGSLSWASPEQLNGGDVGTASDIFSLGTVLWEICTAQAIQQRNLRDIDVPEEAPQAVVDIIRRCRSLDQSQRPTAAEVYAGLLAAK